MSEDLEVFLAELRAAGQPWNRWGVRGSFVGVMALIALQVAGVRDVGVLEGLFAAVVVLLAASWACLLVAFVKRRRWEKAHPLVLPPFSEPQTGER
ncbi:MAG TPA: hypothetical protein VJP88_06855 [Caulobacteraceae bacterium]|nr:hypothetical protein [Caulobacteraceae bacterium]